MMRTAVLRAAASSAAPSRQLLARRTLPALCQQQQVRQAHAISNPTLADIEKRWESLPPQEQADLWMALRDRMKVDWKDMTLQEKKAGTCVHIDPRPPQKPFLLLVCHI
jgi:cytochrome c oxidase subunit 4